LTFQYDYLIVADLTEKNHKLWHTFDFLYTLSLFLEPDVQYFKEKERSELTLYLLLIDTNAFKGFTE